MVDWVRVNELRSEVGEDDFEEIVSMFLDETDSGIEGLSNQLSASLLERNLHALKGSALNIGLASFAGLCQAGEKKASKGETDIDLQQLRSLYLETRSSLLAGLDKRSAA